MLVIVTAPSRSHIAFTPPEATSPGIKVVNGDFMLGGPEKAMHDWRPHHGIQYSHL